MRLIIDIDDEMVCNDIKNKALEPTSETDEVIINALYNGTPYNPSGDLISREALIKAMEEEREYLLARGQTGAEHILVHHCLPIIDNAPTVERPQGECENCDFRKFTETFVDGVVEVMNKNGITSVEQLSEILKGGAE